MEIDHALLCEPGKIKLFCKKTFVQLEHYEEVEFLTSRSTGVVLKF